MSEHLLLHHNLNKPLRLALVLMTMLLTLPQTAWGQWETQTSIFYGVEDYGLYAKDSKDASKEYVWTYQGPAGYFGASVVESGVKIRVRNNDGKGVLTPPDYITIKKVTLNYSNLEVTEGSKIYVRAVNRIDTASHYTDPYLMTSDGTLDINLNDEGISSENLSFLIFSNDDKAFSFILNSITITKIADYNISIGDVSLTGANVNPETGAVTGLTGVYFTPANVENGTPATLTLKDATIKKESVQEGLTLILPTEISSNLGNEQLTINLVGTNKLFGFINDDSSAGTLAFTGDGSLEIYNGDGTISGYTTVNFGDFNLKSNSPDIHYDNEKHQLVDYNKDVVQEVTLTKAAVYPLWVGGVQVTGENKDGITGVAYTVGQDSYQSIDGTVSFNPTDNILTLTDASLGSPFSYCEAPIISNLPNLVININGTCHLQGYENGFIDDGGGVKSLNADATLVFTTNYTASSNAESPTMQIDCYDPIASGFKSICTSNQMIYIRTSNYYLVQRIDQPTMSIEDGILLLSDINGIDPNYEANSDVTLKYKITDASGNTGEEKTFDDQTNEPIKDPCTIEAWAVYQSQESDHAIGKYFAIADKTIVFNSETKGSELSLDNLEISPTTNDEGISFSFRGVDNPDVIKPSYTEGTGYKFSIAGIGRCEVSAEINVNNPTIQVLNPVQIEVRYAEGVVTVVPDKPMITITKMDTERDYYLNTDKIAITRTSLEGEDADKIKIFYTWNAEATIGSEYIHNTDNPTLSIYNNNSILAQTGTLRAWVGYHLGDNEYLMSEVASQAFTVKTDISEYTVQGLTTPATAIYTGAAIVPEFTVVDEKGTTLASTNYTVSYQSVEIVAGDEGSGSSIKYTDVEEMVNVGSYRIVITGIGENYAGTKEIDYTINPKNLETAVIEAIEDQIYTGEEIKPEPQVSIVLIEGNEATVLVKDQDFTYSYEANTDISSETTPKVTVTGKGNYTGIAQKTFNIVESYNVWVAGTLITSANAANVMGGSTARVIFDPATSTLTLKGAYIVTSNSAGIKSGLANLNVVLSGGKSEVKCSSSDYYAFEGTSENATVSFSSSATSEGNLYITTAGYKKFFTDITPAYEGLAHFDQTSTNYDEYFYLIRKSPWTGSGTADDPYLVSTTTELKTISTYVNQGIALNYSFKLNNDIDWSQEPSAFTSIGVRKGNYTIFSFDGTFDGNNKTISNLTSENGLFNYVMNGGSIKNLTLTGCTVTGGSSGEDAAGLVADFRSSGKIENCSVKNSSIANNNYTNITSAGGIVGYMTNGTIDNCSIEDVTITMSGSPTYKQCAGGIVGHTYEGSTITNCEVKVNAGTTKITNTAETDQALYAGAIVGWRERGKTLTGNTYQAGVVVETRQGNNPAVTKSGNTQRGLGDGDDTDGAVLEGVKKITVTKNDNGTVEYVSGIYKVDGNDIYALPFTLSHELTVIKGTSAASYDEPTIAIKTATSSTAIIPEAVEDTSDEGLLYAQWSIEMPNDDATASILFQINLAKEARNFVIADRDYTGNTLPVTEIKTTLDALDASNPAFIELQSGTHFNVTGYKDSQDVAIGTDAPTNAGNYKVVIEGIGDCTGTATISFVINRLAITPELTVSDWIYGGYDANENGPSLTDGSNPGSGAVTFYFKKSTEAEFHTMEVSSTSDAGNYSVYATIAQSTNYEGAQTETKTFTIDQAEITNVILENAQLTFIPGDDYAGVAQTVTISKLETETVDVTGNDITQFFSIEGATQTAAGNYTVTVSAKTDIANNFKGSETANWSITHRTKDPLAFSSGITYQTFYDANESWLLPAGQSAYLVTGVGETSVTITQVSFIKKGVPVLVKNAAGDELDETPDATFATNKLKYVSDVNGFDTNGGQYVLYKDEFVKATGNIPAGKCYLETAVVSGARSLGIENDGTTNIHVVSSEDAIDNSEIWYDLQGRRIEKPTKSGLYIHNNRKIVIK